MRNAQKQLQRQLTYRKQHFITKLSRQNVTSNCYCYFHLLLSEQLTFWGSSRSDQVTYMKLLPLKTATEPVKGWKLFLLPSWSTECVYTEIQYSEITTRQRHWQSDQPVLHALSLNLVTRRTASNGNAALTATCSSYRYIYFKLYNFASHSQQNAITNTQTIVSDLQLSRLKLWSNLVWYSLDW